MNFLKNNILFFILVLAAIIIRLYLIRFNGFHIDIGDFQGWSARLLEVGPPNFYSANYFSDYFPGYLYILLIIGKINAFTSPLGLSFEHLLKFITNIFDIGTAFLMYKIIRKHDKYWARLASLLYLLNPAVIFNSSVWGQVDGLVAFFIILALYALLELKNNIISSIIFAFAILVKPQSILILPILFLYTFKSSRKQAFINLAIILVATLTIAYPFFIKNPLLGLLNLFNSSTNVYPYTSLFAYNFWSIIGFWKNDDQIFILSYQTWGYLLFFLAIFFSYYPYLRNLKDKTLPYLVASLTFLAFFLFPTRIHERYLLPFLGLFLIFAIIKKSKILLYIYSFISLIHLANLYYVYVYYNILYNHPEIPNPPIYSFINNAYPLFAILTIISFFVILFTQFRNIKLPSIMINIKSLQQPKFWLISILVFAFLSRGFLIWYPNKYVFDEVYHAFTAKEYLAEHKEAWEWWTTPPPNVAYEWTHPPLAKEIMATSMYILHTTDSWAYRIPGVILSVISIYILYLLTRLLFKNQTIALFSAFIFAIDGLNFVQSRTGMNDIYFVSFSLIAFFFFLSKKDFWGALFAGLALASKWTGIYLIGIIFLIKVFQEYKNTPILIRNILITGLSFGLLVSPLIVASFSKSFTGTITLDTFKPIYPVLQLLAIGLLAIATIFLSKFKSWGYYLLIPSLIYIGTYIPLFFTNHNYSNLSSYDVFIGLQQQMWWYHTGLKAHHDYSSLWWSWPLNLYPVWYFVDYHTDTISNIFASGNPAVFWMGTIAILMTLKEIVFAFVNKSYKYSKAALIILVGFFAFWLPWAISPRIMFLYHFSPSVPFLATILGYQINSLWVEKTQKRWAITIIIFLLVSFLLIYPMLIGIPLPRNLMLLFFTTNLTKNPFGS